MLADMSSTVKKEPKEYNPRTKNRKETTTKIIIKCQVRVDERGNFNYDMVNKSVVTVQLKWIHHNMHNDP